MNIDNFIQSKEVREYLQEIGHEFTDFEKATIIYNLSANIAIRNEKLVALQQDTGIISYIVKEEDFFSNELLDWKMDAAVITVDYDDTVDEDRTEYWKEIGYINHTHEHPMCIERINQN